MKTYNQFLETPFSEDKKWIQKATKNMRKDKPCTGEKFGSETCPPGSKRYNLAKTFKKMAKEEATPEPPKEDPSITAKEKRQMQIKKQVLLKKMQAVRSGAGADIVAGYEPEGEVLDEADPRLAIYQSGMTDASRVKGRVGKAVDKVKDKVKKVLGKKDKVSSHLDRYRFQSGLDNYLKSKVKKGVKETRDYGSQTAREGDNEAAAAARKRIYDRASAKDKDYMDARDIANQRNKERDKKLKVKEDKAFEYVKKQIAAKYGKDSYVSKDNPMKPPTAAQKKAAAAHRAKLAKQDHRDETEKATSGRYNDRSRSD